MTEIDSGIRFPGESEEYRRERNRLLEAEVGLRRAIEDVARQRRRLPRGGVVPGDYRAETPEGEQMPILNAYVRDGGQFRDTWASELMYGPRAEGMEPRHVDSIWPIWNVLDVTAEGRGSEPNFPSLRYD